MRYKFDRDFYGKLFAIALPVAFQQLIVSSLNVIDTFMISRLTDASVAGVGAANRVFFLLNLFMFGISSGSMILTSQFWGKGDKKSVKKVLGLSLTFGLLGAIFFTVLAMVFPTQVLGIFTTEQDVIMEGAKYLRIVGISYIFTAITFAYVFTLRATGKAMVPLVVTAIAILINVVLNYALIFGNFGFEAMGVSGAAIATVIARIIECVLILLLVNMLELPPAGSMSTLFGYDKELFQKFVKIAAPVLLNEILWSTGVTMYSIAYGRMGKEVMATMTISQSIEQIAFVFASGIGNAGGVMLGNDLGANRLDTVFRDAKRFIRISFIVGVVLGVGIYAVAPSIAGIYTKVGPLVQENVINTLRVYGVFMGFKCVNMIIIVGILRAGGDTKFCATLDAGAVWLWGVPLAFITGVVLQLDIKFVYAAVLSEEFLKMFFGIYRVNSKKWIKNLVEDYAS